MHAAGTLTRTTLVLGLLGLALGSGAAGASTPRLPRTDWQGTLAMHGCEAHPGLFDIVLRGVPMTDPVTGLRVHPVDEVRHAEVHYASDGTRNLVVRFRDVVAGLPHRMQVTLDERACGKVLWRTANRGLVIPGGRTALRIDGYAIRSKLEMLGPAVGRRATPTWVGSDHVDYDDRASAVRPFRWRSTLFGVTQAQLQVSTEAFAMPDVPLFDPCATPGLAYRRNFPVRASGWSQIDNVDFGQILNGVRDPRTVAPGEQYLPVQPNAKSRARMGAPFYVRVVPLTPDGQLRCNPDDVGIAALAVTAKLALGDIKQVPPEPPSPKVNLHFASYVQPVVWDHPVGGETCYRVTKSRTITANSLNPWIWTGTFEGHANPSFDTYNWWLYQYAGISPGGTAAAGFRFCVPPASSDDDGWFDSFVSDLGDAITGFVDDISQMVNFASSFYEELKGAVVKGVAAGLDAIPGVSCSSICQAALQAGLEAGLAAMGLPPSLPNFDQLAAMGEEYLAAEIAAQVGVPPELVNYASGEAKKFVKDAAQQMGDDFDVPGLPEWLVPEVGLEYPVLTLRIQGNGFEYPQRPWIFANSSFVMLGTPSSEIIHIPALPPQAPQFFTLPMVLRPNMAGIAPPSASASNYRKAVYNKNQWIQQKVNGGCAPLEIVIASESSDPIYMLLKATVRPDFDAPFLKSNIFACTP